MTAEVKRQADRFGILSRLQQLESDLLQIEGVEEITFDVANYDEIPYVIILAKYNIPVSAEDYYARRKAQLVAIFEMCRKHDLFPSGDRLEDYGEHWYIVRKTGKTWPR